MSSVEEIVEYLTALGFKRKVDLLNYDVNGNLIANVTMRTGTLASLLSLAGSLGEIGVATDKPAIVVFNGLAGQASAYYQGRSSARFRGFAADTLTGIPTATKTPAGIGSVILQDEFSLVTNIGINGTVLVPTGAKFASIDASFKWDDSATAAGTVRKFYAELETSTGVYNVEPSLEDTRLSMGLSQATVNNISGKVGVTLQAQNGYHIRFGVRQASGAPMEYYTSNFSVEFEF